MSEPSRGRPRTRESGEERPLAAAHWLRAPESRTVFEAITRGGEPARFVGGCVRDTLLDPAFDPDDLDIATAARPEVVLRRLEDAGIRAVPTGIAHGTVTAVLGGRSYEITTLRRDVETYGRHARVEFTDDFEADAARRDFTINAMSCDLEGRLFDPFGGRLDLNAGRVRFVGRARDRIREDYLRILRFFRFFARYGRPPPDAEALAACAREAEGLRRLSAERIRQELARLLVAPGAVLSLRLMERTGVLARILPVAADIDRLERLIALAPESDWLLRLAALLRGRIRDAREVEALAERLRLSRRERERLAVLLLAELPDPAAARTVHEQAAYRLGAGRYLDLLRLAAAEGRMDAERLAALTATVTAFEPPRFPLRGRDLLEAGIPPGPQMGALLRALEEWWVARAFRPDREELMAELRRRLRGHGKS